MSSIKLTYNSRSCEVGKNKDFSLRVDMLCVMINGIKSKVPDREDTVGTTAAKDNRLFVEAVLYRYRAEIPWRDIPERFGDFRVIHTRHTRWSKTGVWKKIFEILAKDEDNEYSMIDSTIVRARQHSAGAKKKSK